MKPLRCKGFGRFLDRPGFVCDEKSPQKPHTSNDLHVQFRFMMEQRLVHWNLTMRRDGP